MASLLRRRAIDFAKRLPLQPLRVARLKRKAHDVLFDWSATLEKGLDGESWNTIHTRTVANDKAPRVLIATSVGGHLAALQFDSYLAVALTLRGVRVAFLLCDAALPACMAAQHDWYPNRDRFLNDGSRKDICQACFPIGDAFLRPLGLPVYRFSQFAEPGDRPKIARETAGIGSGAARSFQFRDLPVGEHALAGTLRFFARADLEGVAKGEEVFWRYLEAGCQTALTAERLSQAFDYDVLIAHHGIYIPQGLWVAATRQNGRRVVTWNPGYKKNSFILSHGDSYHHTMITEDVALWDGGPLDSGREAALMAYLEKRRTGESDWISFGSGAGGTFAGCLEQLGLDPGKPTIGMLTSVTWDAQLHYESNAFSDQLQWVDASLDAFKDRKDVNLIVRIHPAELTGNIPSQQKIADHIAAHFPALPPHIAVIHPENPMNTYALMEGCDSVLIYSTKMGVELTARGIPVIVAGEAWIRDKGFSTDARSPEHYRQIVGGLPGGRRLEPEKQARAQRYAHHFFFRRMVPLPGFTPRPGFPPYTLSIEGLEAMAPGSDANLDMAARNILTGEPFLSTV